MLLSVGLLARSWYVATCPGIRNRSLALPDRSAFDMNAFETVMAPTT